MEAENFKRRWRTCPGPWGVFSLRRALAISYLLPVSAADLSLALWSLLPVGGLRAVVLLICWELG